MSQLLSGKHKGRFAAPPDASEKRSPWRAVPLYLPVPLTAMFFALGGVSWLTYRSCGSPDAAFCFSFGSLRPVESGSLTGIMAVTGVALALSLLLVVAATVRLRKGPLWFVYSAPLVALVLSVYVFLVFNGSLETPLGGLGDIIRSGDNR